MVPGGPRRRRLERGDVGRTGCGRDEAGEERRVGRRSALRRQLPATWHQDLGRDREPGDLHRGGQGGRAGEPRPSQVPLDGDATGDPRVSRAGLDHYLPAIGELSPGDLGQVPSPEQHAGGTGTEIAVAPFGQELIIGHTGQYLVPVLWLPAITATGAPSSASSASARPRCSTPG